MSFAMTKAQYVDGSKTETRRHGWLHAKPGQTIIGIEKGMGLRKGERQVILGASVITDVRRERLDAITRDACVREGFPELSPAEFVDFFCKSGKGCKPSTIITVIQFTPREPYA